MKIKIGNLISVLLLLLVVQVNAVQAENIPVICSNTAVTIQMDVPSTNVRCLTVMNSVAAETDQSLMEARISSASISLDEFKSEGKFSPEVTAFTTNGLSTVNPEIYQIAVNLTEMINKATSGEGIAAITAPIPFLPVQDKTQLFVSMPEMISFQSGSAFQFVTAYGDLGAAVDNTNLVYSLQGISQDGQSYLSVTIPITHNQITGAFDPSTFDWNTLPSDGWQPAISTLDELMRTIILN